MATEDQNKRPLGRLFLEAMIWGAGFGLVLGVGKLAWSGLTKKKAEITELDELEEGDI